MKKINIVAGVVLLGIILLLAYNQFFGPEIQKGEKEVNIEIFVEGQDIDTSYTFNTDTEFLFDLLNEVKGQIKFEMLDSSFGPMVVGLEGYSADQTKEYYHIIVNGEDAMVGVKDIPVADGDLYRFEVRGF